MLLKLVVNLEILSIPSTVTELVFQWLSSLLVCNPKLSLESVTSFILLIYPIHQSLEVLVVYTTSGQLYKLYSSWLVLILHVSFSLRDPKIFNTFLSKNSSYNGSGWDKVHISYVYMSTNKRKYSPFSILPKKMNCLW